MKGEAVHHKQAAKRRHNPYAAPAGLVVNTYTSPRAYALGYSI